MNRDITDNDVVVIKNLNKVWEEEYVSFVANAWVMSIGVYIVKKNFVVFISEHFES